MALITHSTVPKSTPGACSPDAPSAATRERSDRRVRDPGDGMSWQLLVEFAVSIAYGVSSALIPIFNSEIYIVASQVGGFAEETTTAIGCAVGLSIGKVGTVLALRRGANFRWVQRIRDHPVSRPASFGRGCEAGRTACLGFWVSPGVGSGDRLPLRLRVCSAAVPGDARRVDRR
jgi:hypothetical protein